MTLDRVRAEFHVMGKWVWLTPPVIVCLAAIFAGTEVFTSGQGKEVSHVVTASMELFLPLAVGLIVATTSVQDAALELQLTMPGSYRTTLLYRSALNIGWAIGLALGISLVLDLLKLWTIPVQISNWTTLLQTFAAMLGWGAPLLWFASGALCLSLLLKSRSAAGAILGMIWTLEVFFVHAIAATSWLRPILLFATTFTPDVSFWLENRIELIGLAAVFFVVSLVLLRNTEALLQTSKGEEQ